MAARGGPIQADGAYLEILGTTGLRVGDKRPAVRSRKSRAILAYLALAPRQRASRAQLAGLLWSEVTDQAARDSLRQQMVTLRRELGDAAALIEADRQDIWLAAPVATDAGTAMASIEAGKVPALLTGRRAIADLYLADIAGIDPGFDYWLVVQRESYHEALLHNLRRLMLAPGDAARTEQAALALSNLDASNEEACRVLMQAAAARGDTGSALRLYGELWNLLDREFDMEPAAETQALVAQIKSAPMPPPAIPATPQPEGPLLILVGAFEPEGLVAEAQRRVASLRHDLIGALTRFRDWSVREAGETGMPAGHKTYVLTALASQEDDEIFVSIVLRRHGDGTYLWSQRIAVQVERWVSARRDIIHRIASSLEVHLSAERVAQTAGQADHSLDVYDRWLRAKSLTAQWQPQAEQRAEEIFRGLIADAPGFPLSYVGVAQILTTRHHIFPGVLRDRAGENEALRLAKTAVRLDPRDSRTQLCLAWSQIMVDNFDQAALAFELALQLNDNDPWTLTSCAQGLSYCDQKARARQLADRALDGAIGGAAMHWSYQMCVRFLDGDYAGALAAAEQAEGSAFFVPGWKAAALHHLGEAAAAHVAAGQLRDAATANWHGPLPATPAAILAWFMQSFPIGSATDRQRLEAGLRGAGLSRRDAA